MIFRTDKKMASNSPPKILLFVSLPQRSLANCLKNLNEIFFSQELWVQIWPNSVEAYVPLSPPTLITTWSCAYKPE